MIGDCDDNITFPHELLLTNRQVANLCKAIANQLSAEINLSKTQIYKMIRSRDQEDILLDFSVHY